MWSNKAAIPCNSWEGSLKLEHNLQHSSMPAAPYSAQFRKHLCFGRRIPPLFSIRTKILWKQWLFLCKTFFIWRKRKIFTKIVHPQDIHMYYMQTIVWKTDGENRIKRVGNHKWEVGHKSGRNLLCSLNVSSLYFLFSIPHFTCSYFFRLF